MPCHFPYCNGWRMGCAPSLQYMYMRNICIMQICAWSIVSHKLAQRLHYTNAHIVGDWDFVIQYMYYITGPKTDAVTVHTLILCHFCNCIFIHPEFIHMNLVQHLRKFVTIFLACAQESSIKPHLLRYAHLHSMRMMQACMCSMLQPCICYMHVLC